MSIGTLASFFFLLNLVRKEDQFQIQLCDFVLNKFLDGKETLTLYKLCR